MTLPRRLLAPAPGWTSAVDVVIIGSGIAGLTTALRLAGTPVGGGSPARVMVVTKDVLAAGSTRWAQGGIAAALGVEARAETVIAQLQARLAAIRARVGDAPAVVLALAILILARFRRPGTSARSLPRRAG